MNLKQRLIYLPGCSPGYHRVEVERQEDGYYTVKVAAADSRGLLHAALVDTYADLTDGEALDVYEAVAQSRWPHLHFP